LYPPPGGAKPKRKTEKNLFWSPFTALFSKEMGKVKEGYCGQVLQPVDKVALCLRTTNEDGEGMEFMKKALVDIWL